VSPLIRLAVVTEWVLFVGDLDYRPSCWLLLWYLLLIVFRWAVITWIHMQWQLP